MKRLTTILSYAMVVLLALTLAPSCDHAQQSSDAATDTTMVVNISFENRYRDIYLDIKYSDDIADKVKLSQVKIDSAVVNEHAPILRSMNAQRQPKIVSSRMLLDSLVDKLNVNTLLIVDLTLSQELIDKQKEITEELLKLMQNKHLYAAFMGHQSLSQSTPVTQYVIDNKFVKDSHTKGEKYLYRSLVAKIDEMRGAKARYFTKLPSFSDTWRWLKGDQKTILMMSDGVLYKNYRPIDPAHFDLQQSLVELSEEAKTQNNKEFNTIPAIFYYDLMEGDSQTKYDGRDITKDRVTQIAQASNGGYHESFDTTDYMKSLCSTIEKLPFDVRIHLRNPDNKVYQGEVNLLDISFFNRDTLFTKCRSVYSLGSSFNSIVVNEESYVKRILQSTIYFVLILLCLYIALQVIYPAIHYVIFRRKYVKRFYDPFHQISLAPESLSNNVTQECCYYCKAPFEHGEQVVERCSHKIHLECWEENKHQCPEYGEKCPDSRHYYNRKNILDIDNAPYFMKWIIVGAVAGYISWIMFLLFGGCNIFNTHEILDFFAKEVYSNINGSNIAHDLMENFKQDCFHMPFYGMNMAFWITLVISYLMSYDRSKIKQYSEILIRAIAGSVAGYVSFFIGCTVSIAFDVNDFTTLSYLVSWPLLAVSISLIVSFKSEMSFMRALIGAGITSLIGLLCALVDNYLIYTLVTPNESTQVFDYMIYTIGFALSMAIASKVSRRYYLRAEGATKPIDIALYKWYRGFSSLSQVTLGKSVDCNIQMSWDINSMIAPQIGYIERNRNRCYLVSQEDGILFGGKEMVIGSRQRLYHGTRFVIGQTLFTYVERDI